MNTKAPITNTTIEQFAEWLQTPLGKYLLEHEQRFFDQAVVNIFGFYALQLELPHYDLLRHNRIPSKMSGGLSEHNQLYCDPAQLPLPEASIDLIIVPHVLDFHSDPHSVLREVERVLVPEGRVLLSGFNPWSLWGLARLGKCCRGMPWQGNFLSLARIKDWLALLSLEPCSGQLYNYAPPISHSLWLKRFKRMEHLGNRWWPIGGAVYCIEAIKRIQGLRLIAPSWKKPKTLRHSIPVGPIERLQQPPQRADID